MTLPPGPPEHKIIQTLQWILKPGSLTAAQRYGDIYTAQHLLFGTAVIVTSPALFKQVLTSDPGTYYGGEANALHLGALLGERSVFTLDGPEHLRQRRLMMPALHGERMHSRTETVRTATLRAAASWRPGDHLSMSKIAHQLTLDVILRAVMDEGGQDLDDLHAALSWLMKASATPALVLWLALERRGVGFADRMKIARGIREVDELLYRYIARRRKAHNEGERRQDILALFLDAVDEHGASMTDVELRDELVTLLFAGQDTIALTLTWAFEEILRCTGEQERLAEEVRAVTGSEPIGAQHISKLERLDSVIKEVLRLHPVTGMVGRVVKKPTTLGGYELSPGARVTLSMIALHRRPDLYPDPERFDPARFIGKKTDPFEWAPFGGGSRRCIGMAFALHELKVILATLFGTVRFRLATESPIGTKRRGLFYAPRGSTEVVVTERVGEGVTGPALMASRATAPRPAESRAPL